MLYMILPVFTGSVGAAHPAFAPDPHHPPEVLADRNSQRNLTSLSLLGYMALILSLVSLFKRKDVEQQRQAKNGGEQLQPL